MMCLKRVDIQEVLLTVCGWGTGATYKLSAVLVISDGRAPPRLELFVVCATVLYSAAVRRGERV